MYKYYTKSKIFLYLSSSIHSPESIDKILKIEVLLNRGKSNRSFRLWIGGRTELKGLSDRPNKSLKKLLP